MADVRAQNGMWIMDCGRNGMGWNIHDDDVVDRQDPYYPDYGTYTSCTCIASVHLTQISKIS